jgi:hypothetical protein
MSRYSAICCNIEIDTNIKIVQALMKATAMGSVEAERRFSLMNNVCKRLSVSF